MSTVIDSYNTTNINNYGVINSAQSSVGQSFTGTGINIVDCTVALKKTGSPTGDAFAKIYAHSGTFGTSSVPTGNILATSEPLDVSTLTTDPAITALYFAGNGNITLANGTNYIFVIEYTGGDESNKISIGMDTTTPTHAGNLVFFTTSWSYVATYDTCFFVHGIPISPVEGNKYALPAFKKA